MRDKNTLEPMEYIESNLFWVALTMFWYRSIFFVSLPGRTAVWSKNFLWVIVAAFVAGGCSLTFKERRNYLSTAITVLLPYELYTCLSYVDCVPKSVWGAVIISVIVTTAFFLWPIVQRILPTRKKPRHERRTKRGLLEARTIVAVCMLYLLVPLGVRLLYGGGVLSTTVDPVRNASEASEWTVKNNIQAIQQLREETWSKLDVQERLDVLGVVVNIEINWLGLDHELYLKTASLGPETCAHYDHNMHEIVVDLDHLRYDSVASVLDSVCHECYHSYQYQLIDLYNATPEEYRNMMLFHGVESYASEFSNYSNGGDEKYYFQRVETTARQYASRSVEGYFQLLEVYGENMG